jgi:predicted phosphodiesterase
MRIAVLSDIHGNSIALNAVLQDIDNQGGVDEYWILGDFVALGPDPVGTLERLMKLPSIRFVRGNTERYLITGDRPPPKMADACDSPEALRVLVEVATTFAWTQGMLTATGWYPWIAKLPLEFAGQLPDGTRYHCVHGSPGRDDGGINPKSTPVEIESLVADCEADLIFVGHTHSPLDISVSGPRVINVGCVSNPIQPDLRASYVLLSADEKGFQINFRRVEFDRLATIQALEAVNHPAAKYISKHMRGEIDPWGLAKG